MNNEKWIIKFFALGVTVMIWGFWILYWIKELRQ